MFKVFIIYSSMKKIKKIVKNIPKSENTKITILISQYVALTTNTMASWTAE